MGCGQKGWAARNCMPIGQVAACPSVPMHLTQDPTGLLERGCVCGCWLGTERKGEGREPLRRLPGSMACSCRAPAPLDCWCCRNGSSTRGECKGQELQIVNHSEVSWINLQ